MPREQFEIIRPDLEGAKKNSRPRKYDLYDIFSAVLYILRGIVANARIFQVGSWTTSQCGQSLMKTASAFWIKFKLVEIERFSNGLQTSFVIVDSKSIKNTFAAKEKGYDAGKKISGFHLAVDRFTASNLHNKSRCN